MSIFYSFFFNLVTFALYIHNDCSNMIKFQIDFFFLPMVSVLRSGDIGDVRMCVG